MDASVLLIEGYLDRSPLNPPAGYKFTRAASGGTPPYTYSSSDWNVATVNNLGEVTKRFNGSAVITVNDGTGNSSRYTVTVRNTGRLFIVSSRNKHAANEIIYGRSAVYTNLALIANIRTNWERAFHYHWIIGYGRMYIIRVPSYGAFII
jgi:hypothetical protein